MLETPARIEEIRARLENVDEETVRRVVETGASIDELAEALHLVTDVIVGREFPSNARVQKVREILRDARRRAEQQPPGVR